MEALEEKHSNEIKAPELWETKNSQKFFCNEGKI